MSSKNHQLTTVALLSTLAALLLLHGCGDDTGGPSDTGTDTSTVDTGAPDACRLGCPDTGLEDTGAEDSGSGADTGTSDTGTPADASGDAGTDAGADSGTVAIVVDGEIGAAEWAGAPTERNGESSTYGASNQLTRLSAVVRGDRLYLAVEGLLEGGAENAIVLYIDNERGSGVGVEDPIDLTDGDGALDNALSAGFTTPADVEVDFGWGTRDLGRASVGFDDRMGFRNVADTPSDFSWVDSADAPTVCSATACEASILLTTLGGAGPIAIFGRLGNTDGTDHSNQCVPEDDPDDPAAVSALLAVPR